MSVITKKQAREQWKELKERSSLFNPLYDQWLKLNEPKQSFPEFFDSHVVTVNGRFYSTLKNALKPFVHDANPMTLTEATENIINGLLEGALKCDKLFFNALVDCGETPEKAKEIMEKVRRET